MAQRSRRRDRLRGLRRAGGDAARRRLVRRDAERARPDRRGASRGPTASSPSAPRARSTLRPATSPPRERSAIPTMEAQPRAVRQRAPLSTKRAMGRRPRRFRRSSRRCWQADTAARRTTASLTGRASRLPESPAACPLDGQRAAFCRGDETFSVSRHLQGCDREEDKMQAGDVETRGPRLHARLHEQDRIRNTSPGSSGTAGGASCSSFPGSS